MLIIRVSRHKGRWRVQDPITEDRWFVRRSSAVQCAETVAWARAGYVEVCDAVGEALTYVLCQAGRRYIPTDSGGGGTGPGSVTTRQLIDGDALLRLCTARNHWIRRMKEEITFPDHLTLHRTSTLDLELSGTELAIAPRYMTRILLPVKLVDRHAGVNVEVFDSSGTPLSQINRDAERRLVAAGFVAQLLRSSKDEVDIATSFEEVLAFIDAEEPSSVEPPRLGSRAVERAIKDFARNRLVAVVLGESQSDGARDVMTRMTVVEAAAVEHPSDDLAPSTAPTRHQAKPVVQRHRRFGLRSSGRRGPQASESDAGPPSSPAELARAVKEQARNWDQEPHDDDTVIRLPVDGLESCQSFHLDVVAPPGTYVHDARLLVAVATADATVTPPVLKSTLLESRQSDPHPDRAHLFFRTAVHLSDGRTRPLAAYAHILFRPMSVSMMRGGRTASWLSTIVLVVLTSTIGWTEAGFPVGIPVDGLADFPREAVVAVLLLGPTLLTGFMVNRDEALMTKRFVEGFRWRLGCCTGVTFLVATAMAIGLSGMVMFVVLLLATIVAVWLLVVTERSYLRSAMTLEAALDRPSHRVLRCLLGAEKGVEVHEQGSSRGMGG